MRVKMTDGRFGGRVSRPPVWAFMLTLMFCLPVLGIAAASSPTDGTKVPHYFGPYPNWANSPAPTADATVVISGDGMGATGTAQIGANGAVTGLSITNPGSGYTSAAVAIAGAGSGASATATVQTTGAVTGLSLTQSGSKYSHPIVGLTGGGATTAATAHAVGGVAAVTLTSVGTGYSFPTVDFDLPAETDGLQAQAHVTCKETGCKAAKAGGTVTVTGVIVDDPGSGYSSAPGIAIHDGTLFDPIAHAPGTFTEAIATSTLRLGSFVVDGTGAGYTSAPLVTVTDSAGGNGTGATARAATSNGTISALTLSAPGSGYVIGAGIKKFVDTLPGFGEATKNNLGQYLPIAEADTTTFSAADYYVIALVQHRERMSSSLPAAGTLVREYVQLSTVPVPGKKVALRNDLLNGTSVPALMPGGAQAYGVDDPHYEGPIIPASKDRPVRVVFFNLLPTGSDGDLFLPTDSSMMGSGPGPVMAKAPQNLGTVLDAVRNPVCSAAPKSASCFKDNRSVIHLHGGVTPWISDGTPHQWITPAKETTPWPRGVSVENVPDMVGTAKPPNVPDCAAATSGCETFYYTNQQSARLLFYHDHSWGITRLNVYAGEEGGYLISDPTEKKLMANGTIPADQIPLLIQDRTFVPDAEHLAQQDPTWNSARWGGEGNLWYHHVYMPAQNPGDPSGMSAFGRWMYGPWFWPPADPPYGPITNPYYDANCDLDVPSTWQYATDPFCEPKLIPGTPNISAGMEQFNDTPIVNGTAYPTTTVAPKAYRFRILNGANDRSWNLQWYVADPTTGTSSEVALKPAEVAAAQTDPSVFPTPDTTVSPVGPDWIQIGTESGFLAAPAVVKNQPITWITDPARFDFGNVDQHALLLAPAERADTIVDFSKFAGQTLILYNDAPAAFPARVACYDYYTGGPDLGPACAPSTLPGYGPNTRTIMQVHVAASMPAAAFDLAALRAAFRHHADGSGVFESSQHPIIVGQAAYNSAYGTKFAASGNCQTNTTKKCDGFARISQQGGDKFTFDTLLGKKLAIPLEPKALHDEMNAASFDEYGRMTANLGVEAVPAAPGTQVVTLYPFVNPQTELIDATNLPVGDTVTPISSATDGTQIWKITHNGVDTHPIHFHLFDVQVIDRVTWDGIILPPDPNELGWKDTVRVSPLEDTIVALRPILPKLPFEIPNSIRMLNPMMPAGDTSMFNSRTVNGTPAANAITNRIVNFGWEYVYHCHILSHEEMDMMRPVSVAVAPLVPGTPTGSVSRSGNRDQLTLTWKDNSLNETSFRVEESTNGRTWTTVGTSVSPLNQQNVHGSRSLVYTAYDPTQAAEYRVVADNTVGYGGEFPSITASSTSGVLAVAATKGAPPSAPTIRSASARRAGAAETVTVTWGGVTGATGFTIEWSSTSNFRTIAGSGKVGGATTTFTTGSIARQTWYFRVTATGVGGSSPPSQVSTVASA